MVLIWKIDVVFSRDIGFFWRLVLFLVGIGIIDLIGGGENLELNYLF